MSLVIPVRNGESTLRNCLDSVVPRLHDGSLQKIIVVDDGSTDSTAEIAASFPEVTVLTGTGEGAAVARNLGASQITSDLIWFVDSDCVAEPDSLSMLVRHFDNPQVAGAGGTYTNGCPESLLATIIHEEIVARHAQMPSEVNHLATYNVVYRRDVFEELGGFDPGSFWAHDVEFAYRVVKAGHVLRFDRDSRVAHYHPTQLWSYLKKQAKQGYYRMRLYRLHPGGIGGDSYTKWYDIAQPVLAAMLLAASLLCFAIPATRPATVTTSIILSITLVFVCTPMAFRMLNLTGRGRMIIFVPIACCRACLRAFGMVLGVLSFAALHSQRRFAKAFV